MTVTADHLSGRTVLVTGGTRGLGAATVRTLAAHGADVAFTYRASHQRADNLVAELTEMGTTAAAFAADQADPQAAAGVVEQVVERFGRLDVLVANASVDSYGRIDDPDRDEAAFQRFWAVTLTGFMATVRAAARSIADDGRIVMVGSALGSRAGMPSIADNAASKAAIDGYARAAARDLGPRRVTVNVVHSGPMETDLNAESRETLRPLIDGLCLPRYGLVEEVAATIVFLTTPSAAFITGETINVDGGYNA